MTSAGNATERRPAARTKAYDLTKEWRATGGRSGLPVVDLGDVLRVPGPAIERMLGIGRADGDAAGTEPRERPDGSAPTLGGRNAAPAAASEIGRAHV